MFFLSQKICTTCSPAKNVILPLKHHLFHWQTNIISMTESGSKLEKVKSLSHVRLFATPRAVAHQAPPSMGFSRQEYCSGLPFPSPGDLPDPGIEPRSPALQADALISEPPGKPCKDYDYSLKWSNRQEIKHYEEEPAEMQNNKIRSEKVLNLNYQIRL